MFKKVMLVISLCFVLPLVINPGFTQQQAQDFPSFVSHLPNINDFTLFANGGWDGNWYVGYNSCWITKLPAVPTTGLKKVLIGAKLGRMKTELIPGLRTWERRSIAGEIWVAVSSTLTWDKSCSYLLTTTENIPWEGDAENAVDGAGESRWFWVEVPVVKLSTETGKFNYIVVWSPNSNLVSAKESPIIASGWGRQEVNTWINSMIRGNPPPFTIDNIKEMFTDFVIVRTTEPVASVNTKINQVFFNYAKKYKGKMFTSSEAREVLQTILTEFSKIKGEELFGLAGTAEALPRESGVSVFEPAIAIKLVPENQHKPEIQIIGVSQRKDVPGLQVIYTSINGENIDRAWMEVTKDTTTANWQQCSRYLYSSPYIFTLRATDLPKGEIFIRAAVKDIWENVSYSGYLSMTATKDVQVRMKTLDGKTAEEIDDWDKEIVMGIFGTLVKDVGYEYSLDSKKWVQGKEPVKFSRPWVFNLNSLNELPKKDLLLRLTVKDKWDEVSSSSPTIKVKLPKK